MVDGKETPEGNHKPYPFQCSKFLHMRSVAMAGKRVGGRVSSCNVILHHQLPQDAFLWQ
jgi:hypothetical protein